MKALEHCFGPMPGNHVHVVSLPSRDAVRHIRDAFHATDKTAGTWLLNAVIEDDCPLALLTVGYEVAIASKDTDGTFKWKPLDWPEAVQSHLGFTSGGSLLNAAAAKRERGTRRVEWLVLRSALPEMRDTIQAQLDALAQEKAAQETERRDAFAEIHGADLAVITAFLDQVVPPGSPEWLRDNLLHASVSASPAVADLYGTRGSLAINFRGTQITALADHLRRLTAHDATTQTATSDNLTDATAGSDGDLVELTWHTTRRHTARLPRAAVLAAGENNDDDDYVIDGALNLAAFGGSVTGDFDTMLDEAEGISHSEVENRRWT